MLIDILSFSSFQNTWKPDSIKLQTYKFDCDMYKFKYLQYVQFSINT